MPAVLGQAANSKIVVYLRDRPWLSHEARAIRLMFWLARLNQGVRLCAHDVVVCVVNESDDGIVKGPSACALVRSPWQRKTPVDRENTTSRA